jgi:hypothetical protein
MADRICNRIGAYGDRETVWGGGGTVKKNVKEISQSTTEHR